ncbi:hypothetical protein [Sulfurisoma sediminicola]|nr:hypothetical protein [Sulfurisoma sediminicola]
MNDSRADEQGGQNPTALRPRRGWAWLLLLVASLAAAAIFAGYGQPELLLEAVNLRYCG